MNYERDAANTRTSAQTLSVHLPLSRALQWTLSAFSRVMWKAQREEVRQMRQYKIIAEKHPDGYLACPLGLKGVVVGGADAYE
jgi:hypothetical protein